MSLQPLLILLSLAIGATAGVQVMKNGLGGWRLFGIFAVLVVLGFYLFSQGHDPEALDARGVTKLTTQGWIGLCMILFTLSMGIAALITATVAQWPTSRLRRRRR